MDEDSNYVRDPSRPTALSVSSNDCPGNLTLLEGGGLIVPAIFFRELFLHKKGYGGPKFFVKPKA